MTSSASPARPILSLGDRIFSRSAVFAGSMILVTLAAVAIFLVVQSVPAFVATNETASLLPDNFWSYVWPLIFGTAWAAILALLISLPLAWLAASRWLENYPYRIQLGWSLFALGALLVLGIALLTVSFQSIKAALQNPVRSLKVD